MANNKSGSFGQSAATVVDVENHYRVLLGRFPENEKVVLEQLDRHIFDMPEPFITSNEFHENVYLPIVRGGNWNWGLFRIPPDAEMVDWIAHQFQFSLESHQRLRDGPKWHNALALIFSDQRVQDLYCSPQVREHMPAFLAGLARAGAEAGKLVGALDAMNGTFVSGWVWNPDQPDEPATVEFVVDGNVIHTITASYARPDVRDAGFGNGVAGFQTSLPIDLSAHEKIYVSARLAGTERELINSPQCAALPPSVARWLSRRDRVVEPFFSKLRRRLDKGVGNRTLSIVMPVYNVEPNWLREALDSLLAQWCTKWELICVDDCSPNADVRGVLAEYAGRDSRIRPVYRKKNGGISQTTNSGLAEVQTEYVAFMDHDDILEPDAVYHMLRAAKTGADLIYSDEILVADDYRAILAPQIRPAFSWDYYMSHPYFVHFICVKSSIAKTLNGLDESMSISADVDFVLRALEQTHLVAHIPAFLYRWRTHVSSTGHAKKDLVTDATVGALNRHLSRCYPGAIARSTELFNQHRIDFPDDHGKVLVVIPTKNRGDLLKTCIDSIRATTRRNEVEICVIDHASNEPETQEYLKSIADDCIILPYEGVFNYARLNNYAVERLKESMDPFPPYILFANNDIEAIEAGWLERMRGYARRPDVGIVGATLLYPDNSIQHSGVVLGINGSADHAHKFMPFYAPAGDRNRGYLGSLVSTREYSAVTAACMLMRTEVFNEVNGFDEKFAIGFNDTDLCLRVGAKGYKLLNDGESVLYHYESATRNATKQTFHPEDDKRLLTRWKSIIQNGDPFYSPLFNDRGISHQIGNYVTTPVKIRLRPGLLAARQEVAVDYESEIQFSDNIVTKKSGIFNKIQSILQKVAKA